MPAIGYIRVSMEREEMISPDTQRASITACAARTGRLIIDWVEDLDRSGRNFKRKILKAIDRVKAGEAEEIIVWKYSRFGRTRHGNAIYLAELEDSGGRLVSATEDVDTSTATGKFTRGMLLEVGAFESDRAGETWAEAYDHRVAHGLPPLGRPRFGYDRLGRVQDEEDPQRTRHVRGEEERYVPNKETGQVLASMYRSYVAGSGMAKIARVITSDGWRTSYGNKWSPQAVRDVLDSGFGAGLIMLHDPSCRCQERTRCSRKIWIKGAHEPVILETEWEAYKARRDAMRTLPPVAHSPRYPVTALVRCGHCRAAIVPSGYGAGGAAVFTCSRQKRYGEDCDGKPSIPVTVITAKVREWAAQWISDIDGQAEAEASRSRQRVRAKDALERLGQELGKKERELVRLARSRAADNDGILDEATWREAAAEVRAERDRIAGELEEAQKRSVSVTAEIAPLLTSLAQAWDVLPTSSVNELLQRLIHRIVITKTGDRQRNGLGHWELMPVSIEIHPAWEADPWENEDTAGESD